MSEFVNLHIGKRLRGRRRAMCLTQTDVGAHCGVVFQQIQKYECAASQMSAAMLWKIAEALGVDVEYFFDGLGPAGSGTPSQEEMHLAVPPPANEDAEHMFRSDLKI